MPAFAQMHRYAAITFHVVFEQHAVFGVFFVQQYTVLGTGQASRPLRRARVIAQLAIRVHLVQHLHVVISHCRQVFLPPQPRNAFQVLARAVGLIALEVVQTNTGMGIEVGERLLFARHQGDEAGQDDMFEDVGMVAGVEGVTIVHGCSCAGGEVYLVRNLTSGGGRFFRDTVSNTQAKKTARLTWRRAVSEHLRLSACACPISGFAGSLSQQR